MKQLVLYLLIFYGLVICGACESDPIIADLPPSEYVLEIPEGFPAPEIPEDNALTYERVLLGKKLFYDPILSKDFSRSCTSCHLASHAFSDTVALSLGVENREGERNSPSLANVAYHPYLMREGGVPTLEMQILAPIQEHSEFDFNIVQAAERMQADSIYVAESMAAYGRAPDPFVITRAIAAFERTLISGESAYDKATYQGESDAMSESAIRGLALFNREDLACANCHGGFNFTDYSFQNNGLYEEYEDLGRMRSTGLESDRALFKVPSLRNIELTAPYMHDGSMNSLDEVIAHYENGGANHPNKSELIQGFELSESEQIDLKNFLLMLTDDEFINNPEHRAE